MSLVDDIIGLDRPLLLALDVDGTIAPIVEEPHRAVIPATVLRDLEALAAKPDLEVALITGRDLESLSRMERIDGIWRGVEHGGLVIPPGQDPAPPELSSELRRALDRFRDWALEHASDAFVEFKPRAIAVHVRAIAAQDPVRATTLLDEAEAIASELGLHVRQGRCVREAETARHDKGQALQAIFAASGAASIFFAGDDLTDLPAIELAAKFGIGAFVLSEERPEPPPGPIEALAGADSVAALLSELCRRVQ